MQDMTSPIQPTSESPKGKSCWLYGLATIGGCALLVFAGICISIITLVLKSTGDGFHVSNTYTDPATGEEVVVTTTYSFREAVGGGFSVYQLLRDEGISLEDIQTQDPDVLEACMYAEVGEARVIEVYNGAMPIASDIAALRTCIK